MLLFVMLISRRLIYWQVTEHARIAHAAAQVYYQEADIPAARGNIFDSTGQALVRNDTAYLVAADPQSIVDPRRSAAVLAPILGVDEATLYGELTQANLHYTVLARQVQQGVADAVKRAGFPGVILQKSWRASYPQGPLASPILGFVNASGVGQYGLEQGYNRILTGTPGSQFVLVDTSSHSLPVGVQRPHPAVDGNSLVLTINASVQAAVEQRLQASITRYGAANGTAVVMDVHTGAIIAMSSLPSYDPNAYGSVTHPALFQNLAVQNYQPGSTFKVLSIAAGLDDGAFTPNTTIFDPGSYSKYGIAVHNWEVGKGWGIETPEIMLQHSANVGMVQFADMIHPPQALYDYYTRRFGFGAATGVDLPGEAAGFMRTPKSPLWQHMDLFTNSYGQGMDATPLQLTAAVGALANGGWRMHPYIVQRVVSSGGSTIWSARPKRVTRAVSAATAATMTTMLQGSAFNGEAMCALTKDYPVAAKTGTSTIENPSAYGVNLRGQTIASLIGYAPVNNPRFVMLVTLTHPHLPNDNNHIWGSTTAAPTWHDIATKLYQLLKIPATPGSTQPTLPLMQGPKWYGCEFMPQR